MFTDIKYRDTINQENYVFIDVRSPKEYKEATISGAINIPLFDDDEREKVGTVYKEKGPHKASQIGLEIVSPKIPVLMESINNSIEYQQKPIFFCWRGGMRSKTMATLYDLIYPREVYRLEGGYRAYREFILQKIEETRIEIPVFVLHGMTGVGKTLLLDKLKNKGIFTINLEGLAGHRGSIFGGIGDVNPVNQKSFDSGIYELLKDISEKEAMVIEAESKRIGKITIPENVLNAKENGNHILVYASIDKRVERILNEYNPLENKEDIFAALKRIEQRLPTETRQIIFHAFEDNDFDTIVRLLLIHYYDPRYQHSTDQYSGEFFTVNSDDLDKAADEISQIIMYKIFHLSSN